MTTVWNWALADEAGGAVTSAPTAWPKALKASPKATPAFVNWTPAREKRPGPAVRAPRFVGEAAPGVLGVLGVWALGLGEKGVCCVARFCGVVDIVFKLPIDVQLSARFPVSMTVRAFSV